VRYAQKVDNVAEALNSTPVQALFEAVSSRFECALGVGGRQEGFAVSRRSSVGGGRKPETVFMFSAPVEEEASLPEGMPAAD
jgi:predicted Zn-dependent protease with MMP-like domain